MALIINLSSVHELMSILPSPVAPWTPCVLSEFVKLCPQNRWYMFGMNNVAWVANEYQKNSTLINNYKLGKLTTDEFLDGLLNVFSFLKEAQPAGPSELKEDKDEAQSARLSDAKLKLSQAWNSIIQWDDKKSTSRLQCILNKANEGEAIYFISNTNLLNVEKIFSLFKEKCPSAQWSVEVPAEEKVPLVIAPNIHLCLSYRYGLFKEGTPGLLSSVVEQIKAKSPQENITVISQYKGDLIQAEKLKLQTQPANDFYPKLEAAPAPSRCAIM